MTKISEAEAVLSRRYSRPRLWVERCLFAAGFALLLLYLVARIHAAVLCRAALWSFEKSTDTALIAKQEPAPQAPPGVDFNLWSRPRVEGYMKALARRWSAPRGVLSIRKLGLDVPVFDGTDELTLNRGAGRIIGTAEFGHPGNIGIAAHRDGFFRGLKDVQMGDQIELAAAQQRLIYIVDNIMIVRPDDTSVLRARSRPSLTLVTCYPFYFVGAAPRRYVIQASLKSFERWREPSEFGPGISNMNNKEKTQ